MAAKRKSRDRRGNEIKVGDEKPYRVGYGRPPLETRFKPNQSGNPKGRPRRPSSFHAVVETVLEEKVEIRDGDRILRMSNRQALVRTAVRRMLNGDPKLMRTVAQLKRAEVGSGPPEDEAAGGVSANDEVILADYLARHGAEPDQANKQVDETAEPVVPDEGSRES
jgi:Family of unknown function (DUF5681)